MDGTKTQSSKTSYNGKYEKISLIHAIQIGRRLSGRDV